MRERALERRPARKTTRDRQTPLSGSVVASRAAASRRAAMPSAVEPALCTLVTETPAGNDWIHEIKFDGYRIVAHKDGARVRLLSRNGKDWTARFASVARAVAGLPASRAVFDGEVCVVEAGGATSFQALRDAIGEGEARALTYFLFDVVHLDGYDLTATPLLERKKLLARVLGRRGGTDLVYSDHIVGNGAAFYSKACEQGLEGVISKLATSPYRQVRSRDWRKTKCLQEQELVIAGYTDGTGTRTGFGALLLAVNEKGHGLRYAGKVGTGFSEATLKELSARLARIGLAKSALQEVPAEAKRGVHWVKPKLVAEVAFLGWTRDGRLRHPSFRGLREDRRADEVVREIPAELPRAEDGKARRAGQAERKRRG